MRSPGGSQAITVNDSGQVIGVIDIATGSNHAFSWTRRGGMVDLGTLGGSYGTAIAVNDSGEVAGESSLAGDSAYHAALWTKRGVVDLRTLCGASGYARGISRGEGVRKSRTDDDAANHGFSWTRARGDGDLGTLGGTYPTPIAINADGQHDQRDGEGDDRDELELGERRGHDRGSAPRANKGERVLYGPPDSSGANRLLPPRPCIPAAAGL